MKFRANLQLAGKTATGFEVPKEVVTALGAGERPPVRVTINDYTYRNTVAPMAGSYWIGVSAEHRAGAGVAAGEELDITLELDTGTREVTIPPDFAQALAAEPGAKQFFDGLSYSNKRWHILAIEGAKKADTRQRRIEKSIDMLRSGRAR